MSLRITEYGRLDPVVADSWEPVLGKWALAMDQWLSTVGDEPSPYAYNRRTSLGLLSAGILRAYEDSIVLQEVPCRREYDAGDVVSGHADIRAQIAGRHYQLESVFLRASMRSRRPLFDKVPRLLAETRSRLLSFSDKHLYYTAAVFVAPYVRSWTPESQGFFRDEALAASLPEECRGPGLRADYYPDWLPSNPAENPRNIGTTLFLSFFSEPTLQLEARVRKPEGEPVREPPDRAPPPRIEPARPGQPRFVLSAEREPDEDEVTEVRATEPPPAAPETPSADEDPPKG